MPTQGALPPILPTWVLVLLIVLVIWTLPWKAFALWRAARNGSKVWFGVMLVVNTLAILEILYLFVFGKRKQQQQPQA